MKITYYGHGCFLIHGSKQKILIDPFITNNELAKDINIDHIECDMIALTHGHQDHVADVEAIAKRTKAPILAGYEVGAYFAEKDLDAKQMNHGGWFSYEGGRVKFVAAIHSSSLPDGSYGGDPGGFVFEDEAGTLYISGDTALTMDMKLIPMTCKPLDAAVLCIGDHFTMGVNDAVIASDFIACDTIIGAHYDTFALIKIDHAEAKQAFAEKNKTLHLLDIGSSLDI